MNVWSEFWSEKRKDNWGDTSFLLDSCFHTEPHPSGKKAWCGREVGLRTGRLAGSSVLFSVRSLCLRRRQQATCQAQAPTGRPWGHPLSHLMGKHLVVFWASWAMSCKGAFSAIMLIFYLNFSTDASTGFGLRRRGLLFIAAIIKPQEKLIIKGEMTYVT